MPNRDSLIIYLTIFYIGSLIWIPALKLDIFYGYISSTIYFITGLIINHEIKKVNGSQN